MRVALLGPAPPLRGGISIYLAMLARVLEQRGHTLFWASFRKQYPKFLFPGGAQEGETVPWLRCANSPRFVPWSPWSWWRTYRDLRAFAPDVVVLKYWIPFFAPGFAAVLWLLRRRTPVRVVYILDNVIAHEKYPFGTLLTRLALRQGHAWIAQSDQVRRDLFAVLPRTEPARVVLTPHPVYDFSAPGRPRPDRAQARARLGLPAASRLVLCFGFIKPYKGIMHLIEAAPALRQRFGTDLQILVVGDIYGDRRPYFDLVERLGVGDTLRIVDSFVPDEDIEAYFCAADLVVLPYVSATQSGIVQIAYNYDTPVVTTNVGGLPEVVIDGETGFLVPPADPPALAAAIARFFDGGHAAAFAAGVAREKAKYSWARMAETVEELAAAP